MDGSYKELVCVSSTMKIIMKRIEKFSKWRWPVLITGETGTGKEIVARTLHRQSSRRCRPFEAVNCAAFQDTMLESEIFGHVKGAFTGADRDRKGLLEITDGGTFFLDELGNASPQMQRKLLRFLQEGSFRKVCGTNVISVNVRVIAATNCNIAEALAGGRIRQDLYFRLAVATVRLPPLRERREDIPVLVEQFLEEYAGPGMRISAKAKRMLLEYDWPGNVRELENVIKRAIALSDGCKLIDEEHVELDNFGIMLGRAKGAEGDLNEIYHEHKRLKDMLSDARKRLIDKAKNEFGSDKRAAKRLDVSVRTLYN
jgi:transcriptional regulator with PAS, ATPase and Fis domain